MNITLELKIENYYPEDGDAITTHVTAEVPEPPDGDIQDSDWSWDHIFEHTGTGQEQGASAYFVEVTKSSNESLIPVGTEWEFGT